MRLPDTSGTRVLIVGDVMLDRYWFGEVSRISPEAPVPIVKIDRVEERPGGAANVARNVSALGAQTTLLSVVGADEAGQALARLMAAEGVTARLHIDHQLATTVKLRVIGRLQQLLRIDFETPPAHEILHGKLREFEQRLEQCDVVVLSDYGKGGLTHIAAMIKLARAANKPVLVDPKGEDFARYAGATMLTPNRDELRAVVGQWSSDTQLENKAQNLRNSLGLQSLLVTRSEAGMSLFTAAGVFHEPALAREVFDVSGAGDTVIATLAAMLGSRMDLAASMRLANRAAGIVVGKFGTATCTLAELSDEQPSSTSA